MVARADPSQQIMQHRSVQPMKTPSLQASAEFDHEFLSDVQFSCKYLDAFGDNFGSFLQHLQTVALSVQHKQQLLAN